MYRSIAEIKANLKYLKDLYWRMDKEGWHIPNNSKERHHLNESIKRHEEYIHKLYSQIGQYSSPNGNYPGIIEQTWKRLKKVLTR